MYIITRNEEKPGYKDVWDPYRERSCVLATFPSGNLDSLREQLMFQHQRGQMPIEDVEAIMLAERENRAIVPTSEADFELLRKTKKPPAPPHATTPSIANTDTRLSHILKSITVVALVGAAMVGKCYMALERRLTPWKRAYRDRH